MSQFDLTIDQGIVHLTFGQMAGKSAGHFLGEINVLYPFLDRNGRTQREFIAQIALAAGHRIDCSGVTPADMVRACIAAYNGDSADLARLIRSAQRA